MRYTFLSAHAVQGISHPTGQADLPLFHDQASGVRVYLTAEGPERLYMLNRHLALLSMMLGAQIGNPLATNFHELLSAETQKVARMRADTIGSNPVVVIEFVGEVDATIPEHAREIGDFVICFDAFDKNALRAGLAPKVSAVLAGIRIGAGTPLEFRKVSDGTFLTSEDGRVVHSSTAEVGRAGVYISHPLGEQHQQRIQGDIQLALNAGSLERVMRLHTQSLTKGTDNYRAFVAAWSALEILVAKLFPKYQQLLSADLRALHPAPGLHSYLDRIGAVMADKHNLADKFTVISVYLDEGAGHDEIRSFRELKGVRDRLTHGEEVDEQELPTQAVQQLFDKYLRNHLRRDAAARGLARTLAQ
ncbi:MAG: hypothetical protein KDJ72_13115 [Methyloceanibacter sp.]|uniref:hypothetical protein n=1 Tax=Methyloceanibacter sp. TaxID=1965321 RepID=UPI001DC76C50|nr:hypothetical protein [Methyloceanibacter sp.]MCB1443953.1 hypothetical protein [Methyloceanibacter sp.]